MCVPVVDQTTVLDCSCLSMTSATLDDLRSSAGKPAPAYRSIWRGIPRVRQPSNPYPRAATASRSIAYRAAGVNSSGALRPCSGKQLGSRIDSRGVVARDDRKAGVTLARYGNRQSGDRPRPFRSMRKPGNRSKPPGRAEYIERLPRAGRSSQDGAHLAIRKTAFFLCEEYPT